MPLYEYQCSQCGRRTEKRQKFADAPLTECPHCGGPLHKLISAPAIQFKGGGWFADGYGSSKSTASSSGEGGSSAAAGDSKSDSGNKASGSSASDSSTSAGSSVSSGTSSSSASSSTSGSAATSSASSGTK